MLLAAAQVVVEVQLVRQITEFLADQEVEVLEVLLMVLHGQEVQELQDREILEAMVSQHQAIVLAEAAAEPVG
jgi:hypothetical protein